MKHLKKLAALLLAVVMTMAMSMTVFAADDGTTTTKSDTYKLTLTGTAEKHTYEVYQIFTGDLKVNEDGSKVLSNVKWGTGITYTGTETATEVAEKLAAGTMTIADLEDKLTLTKPVQTVKSSKDSTDIDGLVAGYYLVKDQNGTQANTSDAYTKFIVEVVGDTSAAIKSDVPTVKKKVRDNGETTWQDSADYAVNDWVPYKITGTMPSRIADYEKYKYIFTDTMSQGLTYDKDDAAHKAVITIYKNASDAESNANGTDVTTAFTPTVTPNTDGTTTVKWACENLKGISGVELTKDTQVVVTYYAKLNENAVIGSKGNDNEVTLTYSNNPNKGGDGETGTTPKDKNIVFTYKVVVNKKDQSNNALAGAEFTLEKKTGTDANGKAVYAKVGDPIKTNDGTSFEFNRLDDGDYRLTETKTPAGYNTIDPVEFTITATHEETSEAVPKLLTLSGGDKKTGGVTFSAGKAEDGSLDGSLTTNIVNKKGSVLPSTGGVGTRMFYVFGGCLVAAAVVLLALKKRKEA